VAIVLPNGLEYLAAFLAVTRPPVVAPLNPAYKAEEFRFTSKTPALAPSSPRPIRPLRRPAAELGLPVHDLRDGADPARWRLIWQCAVRPARPDDVALFLHTSGTTSRPGGVRSPMPTSWRRSATSQAIIV
jgi:acyl-CoA synthetase (AMP-forming)/AMP-acid ligase II